jgi:hypothetical protein
MKYTKIYVVTAGDYSDYHICGVFDSLPNANHAKKLFGEGCRVEIYKINKIPKSPKDMFFYRVTMDRDGNTKYCFNEGIENGGNTKDRINGSRDYIDDYNRLVCYLWAKNEKHAVKITNERRTQLIALNKYPIPSQEANDKEDEESSTSSVDNEEKTDKKETK